MTKLAKRNEWWCCSNRATYIVDNNSDLQCIRSKQSDDRHGLPYRLTNAWKYNRIFAPGFDSVSQRFDRIAFAIGIALLRCSRYHYRFESAGLPALRHLSSASLCAVSLSNCESTSTAHRCMPSRRDTRTSLQLGETESNLSRFPKWFTIFVNTIV